MPRRVRRAVVPQYGGFTQAEFRHVVSAWNLTAEDDMQLRNILHMCKVGETWAEYEGRTSSTRFKAMKFVSSLLARRSFDTSIRWEKCERTHLYDEYTSICDHTTTLLHKKPSNSRESAGFHYTSGHKGVCYKYLCFTTLQGTVIGVSRAQPGRRNDVFLFDSEVLGPHCLNDYCLADGGYPGLNNHVRIPVRKPVRRNFSLAQRRSNRSLSLARSRVERTFSWAKRFAILRKTHLGEKVHEQLVRLVLLCTHVVDHAENKLGHVRYEPSFVHLEPGPRCHCDWRRKK